MTDSNLKMESFETDYPYENCAKTIKQEVMNDCQYPMQYERQNEFYLTMALKFRFKLHVHKKVPDMLFSCTNHEQSLRFMQIIH